MASGEGSGQLTDAQIARLAAVISGNDVETIAQRFLCISNVTVKNTRDDERKSEAFSREIFHRWKNQNQDENQVQVS